MVILPETGSEGAQTLATRLCGEIARAGLQEPAGVNLADHIRWGLASYPEEVGDPKELLGRAREALIQAWR